MRFSGSFLRTTTFRVAAIYALVYAVLTGVLVFAMYTRATDVIRTQIQAGLVDESTAVSSLLAARGPQVLTEVIRSRSTSAFPSGSKAQNDPGRRYYILATARGRVVVGDINLWPAQAPASGWYRFHLAGHGEILALVTPLSNGMRLLVGQSLVTSKALDESVKFWVVFSAALALLAGLIGGGAVGARVMRRIRNASATAERIQAGHLGERLAVGGPTEHATLARTFNAMLERIEVAVIGLRDLAVRTAHEMRHPLTRADQALARAEQAVNHEDVMAEIAAAREEMRELAGRNEALLRLVQLEGASAREFFRELDLAALAADVVDLYTPLAEERGCELTLRSGEAVWIVGDRQLLAQAFVNLLDNALKYAPAGPIEVRLESAGDTASLEVRDRGSGPGPRKSAHSSGLGLPIARAIAQLHGGRLELEPAPDGFRIRLMVRTRPWSHGKHERP